MLFKALITLLCAKVIFNTERPRRRKLLGKNLCNKARFYILYILPVFASFHGNVRLLIFTQSFLTLFFITLFIYSEKKGLLSLLWQCWLVLTLRYLSGRGKQRIDAVYFLLRCFKQLSENSLNCRWFQPILLLSTVCFIYSSDRRFLQFIVRLNCLSWTNLNLELSCILQVSICYFCIIHRVINFVITSISHHRYLISR